MPGGGLWTCPPRAKLGHETPTGTSLIKTLVLIDRIASHPFTGVQRRVRRADVARQKGFEP